MDKSLKTSFSMILLAVFSLTVVFGLTNTSHASVHSETMIKYHGEEIVCNDCLPSAPAESCLKHCLKRTSVTNTVPALIAKHFSKTKFFSNEKLGKDDKDRSTLKFYDRHKKRKRISSRKTDQKRE